MDISAKGQGYEAYDRRGERSEEEAASFRVVVIVLVVRCSRMRFV